MSNGAPLPDRGMSLFQPQEECHGIVGSEGDPLLQRPGPAGHDPRDTRTSKGIDGNQLAADIGHDFGEVAASIGEIGADFQHPSGGNEPNQLTQDRLRSMVGDLLWPVRGTACRVRKSS